MMTTTQTTTQTTPPSTNPPMPTTTKAQLISTFNQMFKRSQGGGGGGKGPGGPPAALPLQPNALVPIPAAADMRAIGNKPENFYGDRAKADTFCHHRYRRDTRWFTCYHWSWLDSHKVRRRVLRPGYDIGKTDSHA
jgi:hypothetical protein